MAYDFPASPSLGQVYQGYVWDGEKWLAGNAVGPVLATKKNYVVNGAMMVSQENGATAGTVNGYYPVDQFPVFTLGSGTLSSAQVASRSPGGSPNRIRATVTVAGAAPTAGQFVVLRTNIEGYRAADLKLGTATPKQFVLQFGVRAPAGTYCVAFSNATVARTYVAEYVISAAQANTDIVVAIPITGDLTGTWEVGNLIGLMVNWGLQCGSTYQAAAGSWVAGNMYGSTNQFNFMGTINNVFELFDVSLTEGPVAPPFVVPDYASELALCQRYWCSGYFSRNGYVNTYVSHTPYFPVWMRSNPTVTVANQAVGAGVSATGNVQYVQTFNCEIYHTVSTPGVATVVDTWKANARM